MTDETPAAAPSQAVAVQPPARKMDLSRVVAAPGRGGGATFLPRTMQECVDFATIMSKSDFAIPPAFRGNPGACLAVTIQASRWEADPFGVIQKAYVTKSKDGSERLAYEAQLVAAVVNTRAPLIGRLKLTYSGEGLNRCLKVVGVLADDPHDPKEVDTPTVGKCKKQSPLWESDPDQQLAYYGMRAWGRRWVPEVLLGIYTPEEMAEEALVDAPRPQRAKIVETSSKPEGVVRVTEPEPPVEAVDDVDEVLSEAESLTAPLPLEEPQKKPLTDAEAARLDDMREGPDPAAQRAAAHGISGDGLERKTPLETWTQSVDKAIVALADEGPDRMRTEDELFEFSERIKNGLRSAELEEDEKDELRARFTTAYLGEKKRRGYGMRKAPR